MTLDFGHPCAFDRLTYGGNIIETGTESYRLAQTPVRAEAGGAAATRQTAAG